MHIKANGLLLSVVVAACGDDAAVGASGSFPGVVSTASHGSSSGESTTGGDTATTSPTSGSGGGTSDSHPGFTGDGCDGCACADGATRPCDAPSGPCAEVQRCKAGWWGACEPQVTPEQCNGVDDDCDGTADNGVLNACGQCGPVPDEACNRVDDDCDGDVDEQLADCGISVLAVPFVVNHNEVHEMAPIPRAAQAKEVLVVLIDEYVTGDDDDLSYHVQCDTQPDAHRCTITTTISNGNSWVRGRVVRVGLGPDAEADTVSGFVLANGQCDVPLGTTTLTQPGGVTVFGSTEYETATDDEFGFALTREPMGPTQWSVHGCAIDGNANSFIEGTAHAFHLPATAAAYPVGPIKAVNDKPEAFDVAVVGNPALAVPLIAVTTYDPRGDRDASWTVQCAPNGQAIRCTAKVFKGNDDSFIIVEGFVLDLVEG